VSVKILNYKDKIKTTRQLNKLKKDGYTKILLASMGEDNVNKDLAEKNGFTVHNIGDYSSKSVAEFAILQLLVLSRRVVRCKPKYFQWGHGLELHKKNCIVIGGEGRIGRQVAYICKGLGMRVRVFDKVISQTRSDLQGFLKQAHVIFLCLNLDSSTKNFLSESDFRLMENKPLIINPCRIELLDLKVVKQALDHGLISGYACDEVTDFLLNDYPNVFFTPHVATHTTDAQFRKKRLLDVKFEELSREEK